jgi:hypothetical protein
MIVAGVKLEGGLLGMKALLPWRKRFRRGLIQASRERPDQ